jgi:predicted metalloprotease
MAIKFTLFIDESGDAGIGKIRTSSEGGATPYMTLGGALVSNDQIAIVSEALNDVSEQIGRYDLHCNRLSHEQKVHFARTVAALPIRCFGMISLKETLGEYRLEIKSDHTKYYDKCIGYLLERAGHFLQSHGVTEDEVMVRLEEGRFNYPALRKYISACRRTPYYEEARYLRRIDPYRIEVRKKEQEPLLRLGDLVAHALFRCVDKSRGNFHVTEQRYAKELEPVFWNDAETQRVVGFGIKVVHTLKDLRLDPEIEAFLDKLGLRV